MSRDHIKTLITAKELEERVSFLAKEINEYYKDLQEPLHLVGLLRGSVFFLADLAKELDNDICIDFMTVSSYGSERTSSHNVKILKDLDSSVAQKHVLIIEDIVDTGFTLNEVKEIFKSRGCASLKVCALLDKPSRREKEVSVDWIGFQVEDKYIVGYGLDDNQLYRNLPYIGYVE